MNTVNGQAAETQAFDLIIIIPRGSNPEILLAHDGIQFALPRIAIPRCERTAQRITERILKLWGLPTVYLFQAEAQDRNSEDNDRYYVVLESRDPLRGPPEGLRWVSRDKLCDSLHSKEASTIEDVLKTSGAYQNGTLDGPFARTAWFDDLISWVQEQIDSRQLTLTGNFRQLNGSPFFSLVRLETTGPAVWFKAVGEPNLREFPITCALARNFPSYLPTIIATQPSWNAWLTIEVEGSMLDEKSDIATWEKAARSLASLQIESARKTPELLDAGCRDVRIPALLDQIDPFFELMAQLMGKQPKVPPPVLSGQDLRALAGRLMEACSCLGELGLPDTLGHLDFNPGNIMASPDRCVFLDWAEAYIGHPFFTFEYLLEHLSRSHPGNYGWQSRVTSCYLESWTPFISADKVFQALKITSLLAVFAYAVGNNTWRDSQRLQNQKVAGYLRGLTRRMQREMSSQEDRRGRCLS